MDEVNRELAKLRKHLASRTQLTLNLDENTSSNMTSFNSKVNLRPQWMIDDNDVPTGKPHVDAVLQPGQREVGIPSRITTLSPEQLKNVSLRRTKMRDLIEAEGMRTVESISTNPIIRPIVGPKPTIDPMQYQVRTWSDCGTSVPPPPPPLPMPVKSMTFPPANETRITYNGKPVENMPMRKDDYSRQLDAPKALQTDPVVEMMQRKIDEMERKLQNQFKDGNYRMSQTESVAPSHTMEEARPESVKTITVAPPPNMIVM